MAKVGRPSKDTKEVRAKIEEAAALDASVEEIAFYADISRETYYEILKKDPVFSDRITKLRQRPILAARQTVVKKATESYQNAMDYLKRKKKLEFGDNVDVTSAGKALPTPIIPLNVPGDNSDQKDSGTNKED
jgi:hypothetical protein